ncbi:patatin-like phospholipase family protein [Raineyella fluvialis]|uniref:Patatin-like phospholipase family protein n=1 Tax=Raineyella fluvialis TaxID=2662261 RepID=A0A5Q2FFI6_9ACTN|nr:patatin-like phospholipase family protein [Raineyella fluvialis]QGF24284.1 patatin-like phospholipase family protein [Raineyella fluvialis]
MNTTPSPVPHGGSTSPERGTSHAPTPGQNKPQVDATGRVPHGERALVLGGGGSTGNAWLIGVVAGLYEAGLDVTGADLTIGTSAGSTAAAQLAGATPTEMLDAILTAAPQQPPARSGGSSGGRGSVRPVSDHLERMTALIAAAEDAADLRRRMGAAALEREDAADSSQQERWRATVAARLPSRHWPERPLLITAVDACTGVPVVFDRHSGIDLVDAVAASCSSGFAYGIGGGRYIDGGYRANAENADLAAGCARVLVLSPFGGRSLHPKEWGTHLSTQVDDLRAHGSRVETIFPDADSEHLFGAHAMDLSLRPAAARAGQRQGLARAEQLAEFWR